MVKILVLLFGVAMFFGGFWRVTENQKHLAAMSDEPDEQPVEPRILSSERQETTEPIELETDVSDESEYIEPIVPKGAAVRKSASNSRTKSKRTNKGKKVA